jgi:hypothetical protein
MKLLKLKGIFESDLQAGIVVSVAKLGFSFVAIATK